MWSDPHAQSALAPASPEAQSIAAISWAMFAGAGVVFLLVMVLLALSVAGPAGFRRWLAGWSSVLWGGVAFPVVVLSALLLWGFFIVYDLRSEAAEAPVHVDIAGEQWWWRVTYRDADGGILFAAANELHLPAGRPAVLTLTSPDVIHSFWVPALAGKLDMIPGRVNRLRITPERPGIYRGQCAEYCGGSHAMMALVAVVHEPQRYSAWVAAQSRAARQPLTAEEQRGQSLFAENGCGACHMIRGTEAKGEVGPDLTHVGSRLTLAAASFPNNLGTLAGWISSSQHLKPGNRMPSFNRLTGVELRALATYLKSLE
jgi:cytochrome c oxidase subunit II